MANSNLIFLHQFIEQEPVTQDQLNRLAAVEFELAETKLKLLNSESKAKASEGSCSF